MSKFVQGLLLCGIAAALLKDKAEPTDQVTAILLVIAGALLLAGVSL